MRTFPEEEPEEAAFVVRQHRFVLAVDLAPPVGLLLAVVGLMAWKAPRAFYAPSFVAFGTIAAVWAAAVFGRWYSTSLTVMRDAVEVRRGLLERSSCLIPMWSIQELTTTQSLVGLLVGYGSLTIFTASDREVLPNIPDPDIVRDQIFTIRGQGT